MTEEQAKEIIDQLRSINSKLDALIGNKERTDSQELKDRGLVNGLLHICTQSGFDDKQYCGALKQLSQLPFPLSAKQLAWCLMYTPRHSDCGEQIELFIKRQFEKHKKITEFIDSVAEVLRTKYTNDNNADFIEKLIQRIQEI